MTTIGTPHLGSSLADFAKLRVGRVYRLLEALKVDPRGCLDVTRKSAKRFHERFAAPADVPCFSVAGDPSAHDVCWPLRRLHAVLTEIEGPNDGLVSVESANAFGRPLPSWPVDHLRQMNWLASSENDLTDRQPLDFYAEIVEHLASLGFGKPREPKHQPAIEISATGPDGLLAKMIHPPARR